MIEGVMGKIPGLPKFEHHDDRHEPALIAAARPQTTAGSRAAPSVRLNSRVTG
jgi:hypothetical protein